MMVACALAASDESMAIAHSSVTRVIFLPCPPLFTVLVRSSIYKHIFRPIAPTSTIEKLHQ